MGIVISLSFRAAIKSRNNVDNLLINVTLQLLSSTEVTSDMRVTKDSAVLSSEISTSPGLVSGPPPWSGWVPEFKLEELLPLYLLCSFLTALNKI